MRPTARAIQSGNMYELTGLIITGDSTIALSYVVNARGGVEPTVLVNYTVS